MDQPVTPIVANDTLPLPTSRPRAGARLTIGLLRFMYRIWEKGGFLEGVFDAAREYDVNLICFADQRLDAEALQRGWVYDLASPETLDGLIVGGTIGFDVGPELFQTYCQRFASLPRVSAAIRLPGVPWVSVDGFPGMYHAVEHLITVHGHRRIAFIRGPEGMLDANERYEAYLAALAAHQLPLVPALVARGDYSREGGQAAMQQLLLTGADFQAVVAANDGMALGALEVLQAWGLAVPQQVGLVGFDDFSEARLAAIPFTTVRQNIYQVGYQTVSLLVRRLRGEAVPERVGVPTELVVRQSCGCAPQPVALPAAPSHRRVELDATRGSGLAAEREATLAAVLAALQASAKPMQVNYAPASVWESNLSQLWEAFAADLHDEGSTRFGLALENALRQAREYGEPLENWQPALTAFSRQVLPRLSDPRVLRHASVLLQHGQALLGEARLRWQANQQAVLEQTEQQLLEVEIQLMWISEQTDLAQVLSQYLPVLGIRRCYLALYSDRLGALAEPSAVEPDWRQLGERAELFLTCDEQRGVVLTHGLCFPSQQLAPAGLLPEQHRYTLILQSLAFNHQQLGLVGYELEKSDPAVFARLTAQLSHALYRLYLIRRQQLAQQGLELRAAELALANHELEAFSYSVSHDLRAPLRTISGYSQILVEDYGGGLAVEAQRLLGRIQAASYHMSGLIDDMLRLSQVLRSDMRFVPLELSALALDIVGGLQAAAPERHVEVKVAPGITAVADPNLIRIALENLLGNAWKFTARNPAAQIEFGAETQAGETVYFVRDNGAGFDMAYADKLFGAFQRLHAADEFEGTGIGLTIVQRIVRRHAGQIWAEGAPGKGATFSFTLKRQPSPPALL
jgi:DNA-binding LacI/PurR family transcriptional regulator/signal transduction histidine kinase